MRRRIDDDLLRPLDLIYCRTINRGAGFDGAEFSSIMRRREISGASIFRIHEYTEFNFGGEDLNRRMLAPWHRSRSAVCSWKVQQRLARGAVRPQSTPFFPRVFFNTLVERLESGCPALIES